MNFGRARTMRELLERGTGSRYFRAGYDPESYEYNMALSERQLFTQSNARVLLGQDNMGRMHFLAAPHEKDYALPARKLGAHQHITACPGMYYQTDLTAFLGKVYYQLELEDGSILANGQKGSETCYLNDFLPWTHTIAGNLSMDTFSIAPALEHPCRPGMKTLPLPGPSGAVYGMRLVNTGEVERKGKLRLIFSDLFMSKYEHCQEPVETRAYPSQYSQVDRNLLLLQRPEGYTGIYMKNGSWEKKDGSYTAVLPFCLKPGEELVTETDLAVSQTADGISEAMSLLFMHDLLEWILITDSFWKKYLGSLTVGINGEEELAVKTRDMHIRNILDDFNCIQTDENGRVLVHWQGAPSHCMGRLWGIDVEPTTLSFIHMFPELGQRLIEYMVDRNEPRYSEYPDHSVPIMMAPLVMAGEYYQYTSDAEYFRGNSHVMGRLEEIWNTITGFCPKDCALVPSRYSSDGIVMRRYDHGTNVKFWYASQGYGKICRALGRETAGEIFAYAGRLKADIMQHMVVDGPFGKQISGGTNLGEQEDFYMDEDFLYYDGEDSSSVLAPVYGIYDHTYEPWINYHRYARSLFCSNYDPEMDTLRWFPYGGALDGTAYISQLGGCVTKKEMKKSLDNMIKSAVDQTGSLYWWPKAEDQRRMIARCSQGQGSWIIQFMKQWLGIYLDAEQKKIKVQPMGLLDCFEWKGAYLGGYVFDIFYQETGEGSIVRIVNHNQEAFQVSFGCRTFGSGAQGDIRVSDGRVMPEESLELKVFAGICPEEEYLAEKKELEELSGQDGVLFGHFGYHQPAIESVDKENIFLLRFVLGNHNEASMEQIRVTVQYPSWMKMGEKKLRLWMGERKLVHDQCMAERAVLPSGERTVIPVWVELDKEYDSTQVWFDGHPYLYGPKKKEGALIIASEKERQEDVIRVKLMYTKEGAEYEKLLNVPVRTATHAELAAYTKTFLGALSE